MYVVVRHYRIGAGTMEAMMRKVEKEFADWIPRQVGSILYTAFDSGEGTATTITAFPNQEAFQKSMSAVADVQKTMADEFAVEEISLLHGNVLVNRGSAGVAEPIHFGS